MEAVMIVLVIIIVAQFFLFLLVIAPMLMNFVASNEASF